MKIIVLIRKIITCFLVIVFVSSSVGIDQYAYAQLTATPSKVTIPPISSVLTLTDPFTPVLLKGVKIDPQNPLQFNFIIDQGSLAEDQTDSGMKSDSLKDESAKLIKYFLASLTIPEPDLWVNLSPYEEERIIPESFGQTEMGRDLLAQDYLLKQLTASLLHPESEYGSEFWKRIYEEAHAEYGTTDVPLETFHKIWIMPEHAKIYEGDGVAYLVNSRLKVMLEKDYLAHEKHKAVVSSEEQNPLDTLNEEIMREIIIPAITREVNEGKHFAQLRQIYSAFILATWYKTKMKNTLLNQVYTDKQKIDGVDHNNPEASKEIWEKYTKIFKEGIYNFIKEEYDPISQKIIPRKYFSGGAILDSAALNYATISPETFSEIRDSAKLLEITVDMAMLGDSDSLALVSRKTQPYKTTQTSANAIEKIEINSLKHLDPVIESQLKENDRAFFKIIASANLADQEKLMKDHPDNVYIQSLEKNSNKEGRTIYLKLDNSIQVGAKTLTHFRFKGVRPRKTELEAQTYTGKNNPTRTAFINAKGNIDIKTTSEAPFGGQKATEAAQEFSMLKKGQSNDFLTDYPVGWGEFSNIYFQGNKLGYTILGMEGEDVRISRYTIGEQLELVNLKEFDFKILTEEQSFSIANKVGESLRQYHNQGYFNRYPHLVNIGIIKQEDGSIDIVLRDLDTTLTQESLDSTNNLNRQNIGYRLLDLTYTISRLYQTSLDKTNHTADVNELLPKSLEGAFLKGYFAELDSTSSDFIKLIESVSNNGFQDQRNSISASTMKTDLIDSLKLNENTPHFGSLWKYLFDVTENTTFTSDSASLNRSPKVSRETVSFNNNIRRRILSVITVLSFLISAPFYKKLAQEGDIGLAFKAQWEFTETFLPDLLNQETVDLEVENIDGSITLVPTLTEPLIKYGVTTNDPLEAETLKTIERENSNSKASKLLQGNISALTNNPLEYSVQELNESNKAVTKVVHNFYRFWNSSKSVDEVFHPTKNMHMTLDHFSKVIIDGWHNIPGLNKKFASPAELAGALAATIAKESTFNANAVEWVTVVDKNGNKQQVPKAQGMLQFDKPSYWTDLLPEYLKNIPAWSFIKGRFNPVKTLIMGMFRIAKKMESQAEFDKIKKLHNPKTWPGDKAVRLALYYLNHNRGSDFSIENKARVIKTVFSKNTKLRNYDHIIYRNVRKVLMFFGYMEITKKGTVTKVYSDAAVLRNNPISTLFWYNIIPYLLTIRKPTKPYDFKGIPKSGQNLQLPKKVGGIDLDASQMDLEIEGGNAVDCIANPNNANCIQFNFTAEELEKIRTNITGIMPVIINIQPIINLPFFLGLDIPEDAAPIETYAHALDSPYIKD